jgi:DNA end-binding protein Ku
MARASWKGFLRLSLVSVPVQAYTATASGGQVRLHQLHDVCGSRIRYVKTCPIHGEVSSREIVRGYQYAKGQYAVIDLDELEKLRTAADKSITIDQFFEPQQLDPLYFSGQAYYLLPDGPPGVKPYFLLARAMAEEGLWCSAQVVLSGKEQLVVLRSQTGLIVMSTLKYESEVRQPAQFSVELGEAEVSKRELELTKTLLEATKVIRFDVTKYVDLYQQRLTQFIETKISGQEVVAAPEEEGPRVINLVEALKASLAQTRKPVEKLAPAARRKMAGSGRRRKTGGKKKKSG